MYHYALVVLENILWDRIEGTTHSSGMVVWVEPALHTFDISLVVVFSARGRARRVFPPNPSRFACIRC